MAQPRRRRATTMLLAALGGLSIVPHTVGAQTLTDPDAARAAMESLAFLEGDWVGSGWTLDPQMGRVALRQMERVRRGADGTVLLIEGTGFSTADGEAPAFQALAVVAWTETEGYTMHSWVSDGRAGSRPFEVHPTGFTWSADFPGGRVEYSMELTPAGQWLERGTLYRDGADPMVVIEFQLERRPDP